MPNLMFALAGNPNVGKTTIFNALTGARQHVGNYPGVTVEVKEGVYHYKNTKYTIVDLPGCYSLTPYSEEERVASSFLWKNTPRCVVDVVDATNLERNMYLTLQLKEMGLPIVLALNMSDLAKSKGYEINTTVLQQLLNVTVVETVGHKSDGVSKLIDEAIRVQGSPKPDTKHLGEVINAYLDQLSSSLVAIGHVNHTRWLALKLLEDDPEINKFISDTRIKLEATAYREEYTRKYQTDFFADLTAKRYAYITEICRKSAKSNNHAKRTLTQKIDAIVLNKYLGIPLFLGLMYLVFQLTFTLGDPLMGGIESLFGWLGDLVSGLWSDGSESPLRSLLVDGVISGVGGVIVFLPNILLLFLAIALLEDTGYMARAAFIMDRLMNKIGLHGKSFIPMLIGFGCSVPAIMATRTMDNKRDRLVTMLVVPLMSCGARLPIYALIIPAFFAPVWQAPMLWLIYIIGIVLAIVCAKLLRSTLFKGESVPFIMELPPYHMPTIKGITVHMWERGKLYLQKAGTIILGISILLWVLSSYPKLPSDKSEAFAQQRQTLIAADSLGHTLPDSLHIMLANVDNKEAEAAVENSMAGRIGQFIAPSVKPLGFDWRIATSMVGAFAAKEVFVSSMGIVFAVGEADEQSDSLREKLKENYTPLIAFCIMLFSLVSAPCMATIAITRRESNSWKWALFQLVGLTLLAYLLTLLVYQIGSLAGL